MLGAINKIMEKWDSAPYDPPCEFLKSLHPLLFQICAHALASIKFRMKGTKWYLWSLTQAAVLMLPMLLIIIIILLNLFNT